MSCNPHQLGTEQSFFLKGVLLSEMRNSILADRSDGLWISAQVLCKGTMSSLFPCAGWNLLGTPHRQRGNPVRGGDLEPAVGLLHLLGGMLQEGDPRLHTALRVREKWSRVKEEGNAGSVVMCCLGRMAWLCAALCTQELKLSRFNVTNR